MNVLNGGAHADSNVDIQEFMLAAGRRGQLLGGAALGRRDVSRAEGDCCRTAGFRPVSATKAASRPNLPSNEEALQAACSTAIEKAGYQPGDEIALALDTASSEVFDSGTYELERREAQVHAAPSSPITSPISCNRYPIVSIEDGMAEDDWDGWATLTEQARRATCSSSATTCSSRTPSVSGAASNAGVANSILIKVNQIGTLTETLDTMELAARAALHVR